MTQDRQDMAVTPETLRAAGWMLHDAEGFSATLAPFWYKGDGDGFSVGIIAEVRHRNTHMNTVHGGALMTFADIAGGFAVVRRLGHQRCATLQLQTQFIATPKVGEFIQCTPEIIRQTRDLLFVRALAYVGERAVFGFDGIWKVLAER